MVAFIYSRCENERSHRAFTLTPPLSFLPSSSNQPQKDPRQYKDVFTYTTNVTWEWSTLRHFIQCCDRRPKIDARNAEYVHENMNRDCKRMEKMLKNNSGQNGTVHVCARVCLWKKPLNDRTAVFHDPLTSNPPIHMQKNWAITWAAVILRKEAANHS